MEFTLGAYSEIVVIEKRKVTMYSILVATEHTWKYWNQLPSRNDRIRRNDYEESKKDSSFGV